MSNDEFVAPTDPESVRADWSRLEDDWAAAVERVESMPPGTVDENVNGEWSFAQTLRHLVFATDAWLQRPVLERPAPFWHAGLPHSSCPDTELAGFGVDRQATPQWSEVLAARADRQQMVRRFVAEVTADDLGRRCPAGFAPPHQDFDSDTLTIGHCLGTILEEEAAHLGYALRDLELIGSGTG
jgi:hypothetical protein